MSDYSVLGGKIDAIYVTPISGSGNMLSDILKGEDKDRGPVILRTVNPEKFPLQWATLLGLANECVTFSDQDRLKTSGRQP
jgi:hypothetical protein